MTTNDEPTPEAVVEEGTLLPVPTGSASYPARPHPRVPARLEAVLARVRPALPSLARGAAVAATITAGALVAAKAGPRVLQRTAGGPMPRSWLPVPSDAPGRIMAAGPRPAPDVVVVTRTFVSVTRVEVHRYLPGR